MSPATAKQTLKAKGWSYRTAAPKLGVCYQHLASVLSGRRSSQRVLSKINQLPLRTPKAKGVAA